MNKVTSTKSTSAHVPAKGDVYVDGDGEFYILSQVGIHQYILVALKNGGHWNGIWPTPAEAVTPSIKFVGRDMTITISE